VCVVTHMRMRALRQGGRGSFSHARALPIEGGFAYVHIATAADDRSRVFALKIITCHEDEATENALVRASACCRAGNVGAL